MKENFKKRRKKQLLRNNEYYSMQEIFDELYTKSKKNHKFTDLMKYITSRENIILAYRNIKKNKGSTTKGTDGLTIKDVKVDDIEQYVSNIQKMFNSYHPKSVRRVEIPKPNGKTRPLGIPCIYDRLIQQCIKQILEPICEAKFYKHSYGFRPNRSADHALSRCMFLVNMNKLHHVVDVDIQGFFDNVNHSKLKKQIWSMGIQDKNLISIINKILKSEVEGHGVPEKGTPQGGILSPLLSNIVLNELDWWISSQWDTIPSKFPYGHPREKASALRKTNLKEIWIVRYADDFKIFCRDYKMAIKIYNATRDWLDKRLHLTISKEKSKITNLRKNYTEFLGIKFRAFKKNNDKYVCKGNMTDKAIASCIDNLKKQIKVIQKNTVVKEVSKLNAKILGMQNYYSKATNISEDMRRIHFIVRKTLYNRLKSNLSDKKGTTNTFKRLYPDYKGEVYTIDRTPIFPISNCRFRILKTFNPVICNYTEEGRKLIHDKLGGYTHLMEHILNTYGEKYSTEFIDNSVALIAQQKGQCYITKRYLEIGDMECHHKIPKHLGGTDSYENLVWLEKNIHKLIHSTKEETINKYLDLYKLDSKEIKKVNSLRKLVENTLV